MAKPESYPFLKISRKHNEDYSLVLAFAHGTRTGDFRQYDESDDMLRLDTRVAIVNACQQFVDIQAGYIDWLTGEPKCEQG